MKETIELVRELLPLLKDAGEGAFWLIALSISRDYFETLATFLVGIAGMYTIFRVFRFYCADLSHRIHMSSDLLKGNADWLARRLILKDANEWVENIRKRENDSRNLQAD